MFQSILMSRAKSLLAPKSSRLFCDKPVVHGPSGVSNHPPGGHKFFRNIAFFVALPVIAILMAKCYVDKQNECERVPFIPYEFLRRRTKRYPWGEGVKSLFHNDETNALPDGYVDGFQNDECEDEED